MFARALLPLPQFVPRCWLAVSIEQPLHFQKPGLLSLSTKKADHVAVEGNGGVPRGDLQRGQSTDGTRTNSNRLGHGGDSTCAEHVGLVERDLPQEVFSGGPIL